MAGIEHRLTSLPFEELEITFATFAQLKKSNIKNIVSFSNSYWIFTYVHGNHFLVPQNKIGDFYKFLI